MGKGTIISGGTGGQYNVQINYNRVAYTAELAKLATQIAEWTIKISDKEAGIIALENEYTALVAGEFLPEVLAAKKNEITAAEKEKASLLIYKLSFEKRKQYLEDNMPSDETVSAWCADLTEDLAGEVGTVEIPGEQTYLQIQPGYDGNATYTGTRDGTLTPTIIQTAAQAFYNLAMLPGWQKWKPLFRYATITAIDGDMASITLENIKSSQQALEINQTDTISGVEIDYMNCDGSAFEVGDEVLVKFTGQAWDSPVIVGFKNNPKPCEFYIRIKCNGYTPTATKAVTLWYTDGNGDAARQTQYSSEANPDLCGPFSGIYFPATVGLNNVGVPDAAAHPDQASKRLFHFWQEVDAGTAGAQCLQSLVVPTSSTFPGLWNMILDGQYSGTVTDEDHIWVLPVDYKKLTTQLTSAPSEPIDFTGLKILQRRATVNNMFPPSATGNFVSGDVSGEVDETIAPQNLVQPLTFCDESLICGDSGFSSNYTNILSLSTEPVADWMYSGLIKYVGSALDASKLAILTDEYGDSPTHSDLTFSHTFSGYIFDNPDYFDAVIYKTWVLEMIDTPEERF